MNLTEEGDNFYVRVELPGVKPESIEISVVEGRLVIRGERKVETESPEANYHRREREAGFFRRTIALPARVAPDKVSAGMKNAVLTITLPKAEEAKPRRITVKTTWNRGKGGVRNEGCGGRGRIEGLICVALPRTWRRKNRKEDKAYDTRRSQRREGDEDPHQWS